MVTIVITAILMVMIGSILLSVLNSKRLVEHEDQGAQTGQAILHLMAVDIRSFMVPEGASGTFVGEDDGAMDRLGFTAFRAPFTPAADEEEEQDRAPNMFEVGYFVEEMQSELGQGLKTLFRREQLGTDGESLEGGSSMEICSNVYAFDVQYLAHDAEPDAWDEGWKDEEDPPKAVRITLQLVPEVPAGIDLNSEEGQKYIRTYRCIVSIPWEPEPEGRGAGPGGGGGGGPGGGF